MSEKDISNLKGIGTKKAQALIDEGFDTIDDLRQASLEELTKVQGIGRKKAGDIKQQIKEK